LSLFHSTSTFCDTLPGDTFLGPRLGSVLSVPPEKGP
jgi:hypothetical protein